MKLRKILYAPAILTLSGSPALTNAQGVADQLTERLISGSNLAAMGFLISTVSYLVFIYVLPKLLSRFI